MSKANTRRTLARLETAYPDMECRLRYNTDFQLLIATMLVAQSTEEAVNEVTERLFRRYPEPEDFANLTSDDLHFEIHELGLFRAKADHIIGTAIRILDWYRGEVPRTQEELVKLPGVGRKTANLVLANGLGVPALAVDPNVQRVSNRIGLTNSMNPEITERQLCQKIPRHLWVKTQRMLYTHGKQVCTAKNPGCASCVTQDVCQFYQVLNEDEKLREKVFVELA